SRGAVDREREPPGPLGPDGFSRRPLRHRRYARGLRRPTLPGDGRRRAAVHHHGFRAGSAHLHATVGTGGRGGTPLGYGAPWASPAVRPEAMIFSVTLHLSVTGTRCGHRRSR